MDMQNVSNLQIPEGVVRTIHDKDGHLIWGRLAYDTKYAGDTTQNGEPTPDAPVAISVVTGTQTIAITGKNLLDSLNGYIDGYISSTGSIGVGGGVNALFGYMPVEPSTIYTLSASETTRMSFAYFDKSQTFISRDANIDNNKYSITTPVNCKYVRVWVYRTLSAGGITQAYIESLELQFEKGSQSTDYEVYNGNSFTVDLGSTELCKISTYQDYIYKSGDDWYVHKECTHYAFTGDEDWQLRNTQAGGISTFSLNFSGYKFEQGACDNALCNYCINLGVVSTATMMYTKGIGFSLYYHNGYNGRSLYINTMDANLPTFKTNISGKLLYYALATATDTKITDATLIGQLNAVHGWLTRYGYNATVTGNLPIIIDRTNL